MKKDSKFKFWNILGQYYHMLCFNKRDLDLGDITEKEFLTRNYINMEWFHEMIYSMLSLRDYARISRDEKKLRLKKFRLSDKERCPGCDDGKPYKVITYRGFDIPVYNDDYGQQDFAIFMGKCISGGAYNLFSDQEFMSYVDHYLEKLFIDNEYDMHEEITRLLEAVSGEK